MQFLYLEITVQTVYLFRIGTVDIQFFNSVISLGKLSVHILPIKLNLGASSAFYNIRHVVPVGFLAYYIVEFFPMSADKFLDCVIISEAISL